MKKINKRGFKVHAKVVKRRWFRSNDITINITDGMHTISFLNSGIFTIDTNKPLVEQIIEQDYETMGVNK